MFGTRRRSAIGLTLALITAVLFAAAAHAAKPAGMTEKEYAALMARSEALNELYGLGVYAPRSRDEGLNALYGNEWTKLSPVQFKVLVDLFGTGVTSVPLQELRARVTHGASLNRQYGNAGSTTVVRSGGFDWADSAVGVAATIGVMLLASAAAMALRRRSRPAVAQP